MDFDSNSRRRSGGRRFGRRSHRHRDTQGENIQYGDAAQNYASATSDPQQQQQQQFTTETESTGEHSGRRHRRHHRRHQLGRAFSARLRTAANSLYDGLASQIPPEMSSHYQELLNRAQADEEAANRMHQPTEMHEFIDERGPPPPYNPYAPPPRSDSANILSDLINEPFNTSLNTLSKVTNMVRNRAPILNMGIAGAQTLSHAFLSNHSNFPLSPGRAAPIYPEVPDFSASPGPSMNSNEQRQTEEPPAPPPPLPIITNTIQANRLEPLTLEEFSSKSWTLDELMIRVFKGGITEDNQFRTKLWPFILELAEVEPNEDISKAEFDWSEKNKLYDHYKNQWESILPDQEKRFSLFRERKSLIERDVIRCDRTHPYFQGDDNENLQKLKVLLMTYMMYDFDTGYVQGMTDLASPLIYIADGDQEKSFWFFAQVMDFTHSNFEMSQNTIKLQLDMLWKMIQFTDPDFAEYLAKNDSVNCYFAFRWIVCQFKREFMKDNTDGYSDIVLLWESIWTCSAMKRHLIKLREENRKQNAQNEASASGSGVVSSQDSSNSKNLELPEAQNAEQEEPASPLIDLNSVSMKELQFKALAGEVRKVELTEDDPDSGSSSAKESSPKPSKVSKRTDAASNQPMLNYFMPQAKRLSDTELYILCISLCIIRRERDLIMAQRFDATEILKHFNTLELNKDLKDILIHAANIWSWMIYDDKEALLYSELAPSSGSQSSSNLANSSGNLNGDDEYDLLPDVIHSGEDGFLN